MRRKKKENSMHAFRLLHLVLAYVEEINLYFIRFFFFETRSHYTALVSPELTTSWPQTQRDPFAFTFQVLG